MRLRRQIFASTTKRNIVFGEADPPFTGEIASCFASFRFINYLSLLCNHLPELRPAMGAAAGLVGTSV